MARNRWISRAFGFVVSVTADDADFVFACKKKGGKGRGGVFVSVHRSSYI